MIGSKLERFRGRGLLERSTLNVEAGVAAVETVPFVTSSVTLTAEHEGGGDTDSIFGPNLRTQRPSERFVISSDSSHHFSANAADVEVTSFVRSSVFPPLMMTAADTTTIIIGPFSAPILGAGAKQVTQVYLGLFVDSAFIGAIGPDITCPSNLAGTEFFAVAFYVFQEMDFKTLRQIYVPKWNVVNEFVCDDPDVCHIMVDQLAPPGLFSQLCGMDYDHLIAKERKRFKRRCPKQVDLLKETDVEIANLKAQLSLKEVDATEPIRLRSQVATLEFVAITKDTELASLNAQTTKLTQDLSSLQLSCDELSIKAASLESQRDGLTDRVSLLKTTCFGLRDQVSCYELFKEQCKAIQDAQLKEFSDRVIGLDSEIMSLALHLDEEFYPRFLTTIAGRRWIIGHGLRLAIMSAKVSKQQLNLKY
ncbi:hypothetical protein Tco_1356741 [Tanacetum coccineum]